MKPVYWMVSNIPRPRVRSFPTTRRGFAFSSILFPRKADACIRFWLPLEILPSSQGDRSAAFDWWRFGQWRRGKLKRWNQKLNKNEIRLSRIHKRVKRYLAITVHVKNKHDDALKLLKIIIQAQLFKISDEWVMLTTVNVDGNGQNLNHL